MTKAELIEEVSRVIEMTRKDSEVIVESIFDSVVRALRNGDKIEIRGFGSFRTRQRQPRIGRNPKTGTRVEVPAKRIPYFKPSKELKDLVNPEEAAEKSAAPPAAPHPAPPHPAPPHKETL
jgi:integration host factor subunit beta